MRSLLSLPRVSRPDPPKRPPKQAQKRLTRDELAELVAAYKAGGRAKELAVSFGVHRTTLTNILKRHGVTLRPPGMHPDDLAEAIWLYQQGWSLATVGEKFGVGAETVRATLRRAGVTIRPRPGWSKQSAG
jgi:lambda repressor-like predicted transcriptional regulator